MYAEFAYDAGYIQNFPIEMVLIKEAREHLSLQEYRVVMVPLGTKPAALKATARKREQTTIVLSLGVGPLRELAGNLLKGHFSQGLFSKAKDGVAA
jgi:hypothetical protein